MKIIVCIKEVIDPNLAATSLEFDSIKNKVVPSPGVWLVINPFDEQALEAALRVKDAYGGEITVITLGVNLDRHVLRKPMATGPDELILLEDEAFGGGDSWSIAYALAMAIKKIGNYDLVFCGRQAADWDAGQVGSGIAEILGLPSVTVAKKIDFSDGKARVERVTDDGYEVVRVTLPALITVGEEIGELRSPTMTGMIAVKKRGCVIWKPADIGVESTQIGSAGQRLKLVKLFQPVHEGKCEIVEGDSPEEAAVNLALRLKEAKILK